MKTRLCVVIIITIVTSLAAQDATQPAGSQKRSLTEKDLFDFVWVANPASMMHSPAGRLTASI